MQNYNAKTVFDLDFEKIKSSGVKNIIFDIDNTLATYAERVPSQAVCELVKKLREELGFSVACLSNGHSERAETMCKTLEMTFVGDAFKPSLKGIEALSKKLEKEILPEETIIVGDQIFTDIWCAKRFGCVWALVVPIDRSNEPAFVKFKRIFEKLLIKSLLKNSEKAEKK